MINRIQTVRRPALFRNFVEIEPSFLMLNEDHYPHDNINVYSIHKQWLESGWKMKSIEISWKISSKTDGEENMWNIAPKSHSVSQVSSHKFINSHKKTRRLYEFKNQRVLCEYHKTADKYECVFRNYSCERNYLNVKIIILWMQQNDSFFGTSHFLRISRKTARFNLSYMLHSS